MMQHNSKRILFLCISIFIFTISAVNNASALITETQVLSFGTFALTDNSAVYDMQVQPNGTIVADVQFAIVVDGQEASYDASSFPASTTLIVSVVSGDLSLGGLGGGELFDIVSYQNLPASPVTDGSGDATFTVGATLQTSGSTTMYTDGGFSGTGTITVNF